MNKNGHRSLDVVEGHSQQNIPTCLRGGKDYYI